MKTYIQPTTHVTEMMLVNALLMPSPATANMSISDGTTQQSQAM